MDNDNTQQPSPNGAQGHPVLSGQKVIQPSASIHEELRALQSNTQPEATAPPAAAQPELTPQGTSQGPPAMAITQEAMSGGVNQGSTYQASSIYPEATKGLGESATPAQPVVPSTEPPLVDAKAASKIMAVRVVAGLLILLNLINAYDWYLEKRAGYTGGWTSLVGTVIGTALAIGIFKLSDAFRVAYVFVSVFLLILTAIGFIVFTSSTHGHVNTGAVSRQAYEVSLAAAEKNPSYTPAERAKVEHILQADINRLSGSPVDVKFKQYMSEALSIVVAVGPLIFFTRPSIKALFS